MGLSNIYKNWAGVKINRTGFNPSKIKLKYVSGLSPTYFG